MTQNVDERRTFVETYRRCVELEHDLVVVRIRSTLFPEIVRDGKDGHVLCNHTTSDRNTCERSRFLQAVCAHLRARCGMHCKHTLTAD